MATNSGGTIFYFSWLSQCVCGGEGGILTKGDKGEGYVILGQPLTVHCYLPYLES